MMKSKRRIHMPSAGNSNDMVVDRGNWMVVVSEMGRRLCPRRDYLWKGSIHAPSSRSNFSLLSIC
jgi:hypothetical protein